MNKAQVMEVLPHRGVMLMIDGVEELDCGRRVLAYRDIAPGEFWCDGHFHGHAILPGVLIIEMMAQACAFLFVKENETLNGVPRIAKVDEMKFLEEVRPGSRLYAEALFDAEGAGFTRAKCRAFHSGSDKPAAKGKLTCRISYNRGNSNGAE